MTRRTLALGALALAATATTACGDREPRFEVSPKLFDPAAVDDHVVFVDSARAEARVLDVSGSAPPAAPTVVPLVPNATHAEARKGHSDQLLVLCAGQRDIAGSTPAQPGLVVLGADGKNTTFRYDSAFDRIAQSDDGRFAFLFYDPSKTTGGDALKNPNEVAVIDLDAKSAKPSLKTLRSLGESPRTVSFSPSPVNVSGTDRNLAVVLLDKDFAVIDLSHFDRSEFTVELTKPGASSLTAAQVLYSTKEAKPKIYLRADGTDDVFVVTLDSRTTAGASSAVSQGDNDFVLSFNQFGTGMGARPADIALFEDGGATRLLVTGPGNGTAIVVDADTGNTATVMLPAPQSKIHLFTGPKPSDATPAPRALLYTPGGQSVVFLDLAGFGTEDNRAGNAELLALPTPYANLSELDDDTVMLPVQGNGFNLLKLGDRAVSPITGPNVVDAVPDLAVGKLWLAPVGTELGYLDLSNFHPNEVRLDDSIEHIVSVPSRSSHPKVVATHPSSLGSFTVIDAKDPSNLALAYTVNDFLFQGVLGGGSR
jgi:hypothetical protein